MDVILAKTIKTIMKIVELLVKKKYQALELLSNGSRLSASEINQAICDYDAELIMPPQDDFLNIDSIEIINSNPKSWSIRYDLWTVEEGRSDLTLEVTLIDTDDDLFKAELDNIHVL